MRSPCEGGKGLSLSRRKGPAQQKAQNALRKGLISIPRVQNVPIAGGGEKLKKVETGGSYYQAGEPDKRGTKTTGNGVKLNLVGKEQEYYKRARGHFQGALHQPWCARLRESNMDEDIYGCKDGGAKSCSI